MLCKMGQEYQLRLRMYHAEEEMEGTNVELDSSLPRAQGHDYLSCGSPLPPDPVPPPGLAAGGEKIWASPSLSPSTGPEGIESSAQSGAPLESPSARGHGSGVVASAVEDSQLEPDPYGGPCPRSVIGRSSPAQRD